MHQSQQLGDLLNSVGWFTPPFVGIPLLETVALAITRSHGSFTQDQLEVVLASVYKPDRLASMVLYKYPVMPVVKEYGEIIAESVAAHFLGLNHVAVGGLMPVVEGIGRGLVEQRGLRREKGVKRMFRVLLDDAIDDAVRRKLGLTQEIVEMLGGFQRFLEIYFFTDSQLYPLLDKTNRHGVAHGAYRDRDFGRPINFYKTISTVDILTFVSMLQTGGMSGFVPDHTAESTTLADKYRALERERL